MPLKKWNGDQLASISQRITDAALVKVSSAIVEDAQDKAPKGITGNLANSIRFTRPRTGGAFGKQYRFTEIGFGGGEPAVFRYAMAMERGRLPGKGVPPGALNLWVRRRLGITDTKEIRSVAFLISRHIKQHGIKGRHFMYNAYSRHARELKGEIAKGHRRVFKRG